MTDRPARGERERERRRPRLRLRLRWPRPPWARRNERADGEPVGAEATPPEPAASAPAASEPPPAGRPSAAAPARERNGPPAAPRVGRIAGSWRRRLAADPWPRSALTADFGELGDFTLAAASAVGRSHAHESRPRQDAYGFAAVGTSVVCAIADGVSQTPLGGAAADVAVAATLASLEAEGVTSGRPVDERIERALDAAQRAVAELERELDGPAPSSPRALATTLLLAAADVSDGERLRVFLASIGDSCALAFGADGALEDLLEHSGGGGPLRDYLPKASSHRRLERVELELGATLVLATDGLAHDLRASETVRRWVADGLAHVDSPYAAAHLLAYERQGSADDLTFLALRRSPRR